MVDDSNDSSLNKSSFRNDVVILTPFLFPGRHGRSIGVARPRREPRPRGPQMLIEVLDDLNIPESPPSIGPQATLRGMPRHLIQELTRLR